MTSITPPSPFTLSILALTASVWSFRAEFSTFAYRSLVASAHCLYMGPA